MEARASMEEQMSFRYVRLGALFSTNPKEARNQLGVLIAAHGGNMSSVSRELGVDRATVLRWCRRCRVDGLGDPRHDPIPQAQAQVPRPVPSLAEVKSFLGEPIK